MDLMHETEHLKSLQSFAFTLSDLDSCKLLQYLLLKSVIDFYFPLCYKSKLFNKSELVFQY